MRYAAGLVLALALGAMGCSDESGDGGDGGTGTPTFTYSVITSGTGDGADLLEELGASTLPALEEAGAVVYALWGPAAEQDEEFSEIAQDRIVVMLSWARADTELLTMELEALAGASQVETSLWEARLRGEEPLPTGQGFYIHRFNRTLIEDVEQWHSLSEQAWVTSEPFWENEVVGAWRDFEEEDGLAHLLRIAWYRDLEHWFNSREFVNGVQEPISANLIITRGTLEVEVLDNGVPWSASLIER